MKNIFYLVLVVIFNFSCTDMTQKKNPLLTPFTDLHETAPFDKIKTTDFEPAISEAIALHQAEIDSIVQQSEAPTFKNTIEASGTLGQQTQPHHIDILQPAQRQRR